MTNTLSDGLMGRSFRRWLGRNVVRLRDERGWSQYDLADLLDLPRSRVSKWERGVNAPPPEDQLAMCRLFGITADELLRGKAEAPPLAALEDQAREQVMRYLKAMLQLLETSKSDRSDPVRDRANSGPVDTKENADE